jgi:hypothetical protein
MKSTVFWDVMLHNLETTQHSGKAYWLHLLGQSVRQARNHLPDACHLLLVGILLGVLFNPEDGGDMFLQNTGILQTTYHYNPEDCTLHIHYCENLKSKTQNYITFSDNITK